jgi:hypothetical protein
MEKGNANDHCDAMVFSGRENLEQCNVHGVYDVICWEGEPEKSKILWKDKAYNTVVTVGANQIINSAFGAGPVAGPFLGLISSVGWSAVAAGDTMASHAGWNEAGNGVNYPLWSTPASNARIAVTFGAAAARTASITAVNFIIATTGGTVEGCFIVMGTGAVVTNNNTSGVLLSAGVFGGGAQAVAVGNTLQVGYSFGI